VAITWQSSHAVTVTLNLSGMAGSTTYAVGIFAGVCGSSASLEEGFPAAGSTAGGGISQTLQSVGTMSQGIPGRSSLRIGPPGTEASGSAANAVACANTQDAITKTNQTYTTHVS
jgi:hypothetical protein